VVTHPLWEQEIPGSITGSVKGLYVFFSFVVVVFLLFVQKNHY